MEFLNYLYEQLANALPYIPAFPIMILMFAIISIVGAVGTVLGFNFDEIMLVTDNIRGIFGMAMKFIVELFGGSWQ